MRADTESGDEVANELAVAKSRGARSNSSRVVTPSFSRERGESEPNSRTYERPAPGPRPLPASAAFAYVRGVRKNSLHSM